MPSLRSFFRLLAKTTVQELLGELDALEFHKPSAGLDIAIQRKPNLPRTGKHCWILDGGFVHQVIGAYGSVTFDDVQGITVEIPGSVEPRQVIEPLHIYDQRIPIPAAARLSHPR